MGLGPRGVVALIAQQRFSLLHEIERPLRIPDRHFVTRQYEIDPGVGRVDGVGIRYKGSVGAFPSPYLDEYIGS